MLQREHSAILLTFIKLSFVIKIIVLSIFEWLFYTGFTVVHKILVLNIEGSDESAYMYRLTRAITALTHTKKNMNIRGSVVECLTRD